jgi:hypothetical protein
MRTLNERENHTVNQFAKEFVERETGVTPGEGYELSFDQLGESKRSLQKRAGKVGFRTSLTEFFKAARRRGRERNPIAPNQADIVKWILYDRFQFASGTTVPNNFKFFTSPIGQNGKTKVDTNMEQVQRLADPLWFNTEGIGFFFGGPNDPTDINGFLDTEYMEYWVGQKVYLEGPVQCFPGGAGLQMAAAGVLDYRFATNGVPRTDNVFDVRLPAGIHLGTDTAGNSIVTDGLIGITILQGQQFRVEMQAPAGGFALEAAPGSGLNVMCYLYGILSRGVQ